VLHTVGGQVRRREHRGLTPSLFKRRRGGDGSDAGVGVGERTITAYAWRGRFTSSECDRRPEAGGVFNAAVGLSDGNFSTETCSLMAIAPSAHVFERPPTRIRIDQQQRRIGHPRPMPLGRCFVDGREPDPLLGEF